jgi:hypothetical protein
MIISGRFPLLTAYALLAAVVLCPGLSRAQIYPGITGTGINQAANPYSAASNPYLNGLNSSAYGSYVEPDISGYLRGTADIITSLGRQQIQQTLSMREKYKQEQIATQRKRLDEYLFEREKTPTFEAERRRAIAQQVSRSLNNPPLAEIWSGQALNDVVRDIRKGETKKGGRPVLIDEDAAKHINLTPGVGNPGLLKNEGHVAWPLVLLSDDYKPQRELLNALAPEAFRQAINGRVDPGTLKSMNEAVATLHDKVTANVRDMTATQYIEASCFVGYFGDGLKILGRPDAGDLFSLGFWRQGMNVADLVKYMADKGLVFAPAMTGDESAYQAVHRALVAYDRGTSAEYTAQK